MKELGPNWHFKFVWKDKITPIIKQKLLPTLTPHFLRGSTHEVLSLKPEVRIVKARSSVVNRGSSNGVNGEEEMGCSQCEVIFELPRLTTKLRVLTMRTSGFNDKTSCVDPLKKWGVRVGSNFCLMMGVILSFHTNLKYQLGPSSFMVLLKVWVLELSFCIFGGI